MVDSFGDSGRYFNTFAGTPVAAAVGRAVLEVLAAEGLIARARGVSVPRCWRGCLPLVALPAVRDVRGVGLFVAVEMEPDSPLTAAAVVEDMRHNGVLAGVTGPGSRVVKIRPPLAFSELEIEPLADTLEHALKTQLQVV